MSRMTARSRRWACIISEEAGVLLALVEIYEAKPWPIDFAAAL